jgi:hypothetical protein
MIPVKVISGANPRNYLKIGEEGECPVVVHRHPPQDEEVAGLPFRQYFTDNGTTTGSNDLKIDGATTPTDFSINALEDADVYIKSISVIIGDGGSPALNKYGSLTALTNGVQWCYFNQDIGLYELHEGIKTNLEFTVRLGNESIGIGTGTDAMLYDVSGGGTEKSYAPFIDVDELFGLPYGVRLRKGTTDRLVFTVRDDLTALTTHNIIGYGMRI